MAETLEKVIELRALANDQHLFCPRNDGDDGSYFEEDVANLPPNKDPDAIKDHKEKIQKAETRKWFALEALELLAYDGEEVEAHKVWLTDRLNNLMTSCDVCVRVFHQSRPEWKNRLLETYDDSNAANFLGVIDDLCIKRITHGLDEASNVLRAAGPKERGVRILPNEATYAFFEALSCDAFIRNEELLQRHFDTPFQLVQSRKRLKLQTFLPAMTKFLFSGNEHRQNWAAASWSTSKRDILPTEFEWAARDYLIEAMMRIQMTNLELPFVSTFWNAMRLVISKSSKNLITHSIRGLDGDFYRLLLDHLSLRSEGFLDLVATMTVLLEKSPADFWDAIDAITPSSATVVEQVFNSPVLNQLLLVATEEEQEHLSNLDDAFVWINPFLSSIKAANLAPVCVAFSNRLLDRLQEDQYSRASRARCFKEGLRVLEYAFKKMNKGKTKSEFVGQPTVNGMLKMLSAHIEIIVTSMKRLNGLRNQEDLNLTLSVVQEAFTLECQSLAVERQLFVDKKPSPTESPPSTPIWKAILKAIDSESIELATHMLIAGRNLIGLEPLYWKSNIEEKPPAVRHFNGRFELLSQSITDVIDRLADFGAEQLDVLLEQPSAASAIVSSLFSSTEATRNSTIELLKVISGQDERRNALQYALNAYYKNVLQGISNSCRQIMLKKTFAPEFSMIKTCSDIVDVMCNSQDGILRSRALEPGDAGVTMNFWKNLWDTLHMIFRTTEPWANAGYARKDDMLEFCRDVMQFADELFDHCSIFTTALNSSMADPEDSASKTKLLKELLDLPSKTMDGMAQWLRLRDEFLSERFIKVISKILISLRRVGIEVDPETLTYMQNVWSGEIRAKLNRQQQAELLRALEIHLGRPIAKAEEPAAPKQSSLNKYAQAGVPTADSRVKPPGREDKFTVATPGQMAFRERDALKKQQAARAKEAQDAKQSDFRRKRQLDKEKEKNKRAAEIAKARQARGLSDHTAEAGSGLDGLGVLGKEQAAKGEGLMHSSDDSDEEGDFDEELFGVNSERKAPIGPKTNIINEVKIQMPVKKRRVVRSAKDMRARLAPDLSPLHKVILSWDYYHQGDFPPNSRPDSYTAVPKTFRTPRDYQTTFEPLLTLEAWQGFVKAREENVFKPYEIRIVSRASVDAFQEVSSTMTHLENKDLHVSEGDVILLSQSKAPSSREPHCLARVFRVLRKQAHIEVSYRIMPGNPLSASLVPNRTIFGSKIQSITPLEREYGALLGLEYYDLCDEIARAKPSPLLSYRDSQLDPLISNYSVNKAQAAAVKSAVDNDAFTLIQGPPGSGKTKTIVAIVGALLSDTLRHHGIPINVPGQPARSGTASKKLLVCAPSNAAVDELVMRFKDGIKTMKGQERKVNIVRIGRSDAINSNVQDVTLETLVNRKLGVNDTKSKDSEATRKIFQEHKQISEQLRQSREQLDSGTVKGPEASKLQDDVNSLRRRKALLGTQIDTAKDNERHASRNADMRRRQAQEQVLGDAHVICATLSGSGHEMFQGLSVEFETVIVDEAAQCVEMSALIPLKYGCAKCILVGDPKQLPPTVFSKEAARFQYEQSLFVRMQANHPRDVHLLDTQYRMHPEISLFPSQTFYDGRLLDGRGMAPLRKRPWHSSSLLAPYRFFDVQGQQQAAPKGHSLINIAEINIALKLYNRLVQDFGNQFDFKGKIGIITPYKSQLGELKTRFSQQYGPRILEDVEFNTTDAFQGRESEVIIFSCVRASPAGGIGFLQDIRRMNVGLTRAKSSLWVLGNSQSLIRGQFWKKLVDDARSRRRYTEGNVREMLNKHSSAFPNHEQYTSREEPLSSHAVSVKEEDIEYPMSRSTSNHSSNSSTRDSTPAEIKRETRSETSERTIKQEPVDEFGLVLNGKRKFRADSDVFNTGEFEGMSDANSNSNRSTPAPGSNSERNSSTPAPEIGKKATDAQTSNPRDVIGNMTRPKIRRRPKEVDPFIRRPQPKKPRTS